MNKRGQGLSTTTIILIILGILILVFLVIGFTIGWQKILPWIKPSANVDEVVQQCKLACDQGQKYAYCSQKRVLYTETITLNDVNCNFLAKKTNYGIGACSLTCDSVLSDFDTEEEVAALCADAANKGKTIEYLSGTETEKALKTYTCPSS